MDNNNHGLPHCECLEPDCDKCNAIKAADSEANARNQAIVDLEQAEDEAFDREFNGY